MQPTRRARLEAVIQEELAQLLTFGIKDPRVQGVTLTKVHVNEDGSVAQIGFTLLGASLARGEVLSEKQEKELGRRFTECQTGLESASGFLRRQLSEVLTVRHIPHLVFKEDRGFENSIRVNELLKKIESEKQKTD